jgi:hypothetical protein
MRHWGDLEGARIIETRNFAEVGRLIETVVADAGIGLVFGEGGVGKSFTIEYHLSRLKQPTVDVIVPERASPRSVAAAIYGALTGDEEPTGTRSRLETGAIRLLADRGLLLNLDECQELKGLGFRVVRSIFNRAGDVPCLFAGGPEFSAVIAEEPMLLSRVVAQETMLPLTTDDVLEAVPSYHPIYADAELELIARIDQHLHGFFRPWATFTKQAGRMCAERDASTIDEGVAETVLRNMGRW